MIHISAFPEKAWLKKILNAMGLLERGTWNCGTYRLHLTETVKVIANIFFRHTFSGFMNNTG
jgi:hypothetical protein